MSSSVDSRITTMKFDNAQFERGAAETMSTLDKLKKMLGFETAGKGLADVQKAANNFRLNPMENAISGVSKSWLAMSTVAITALATITHAAINEGKKIASGFLGPVKAGLQEYETTLNSVQTILANTGLRGEKGLNKVNNVLQDLNAYSDKTIYNFSQMAKNIGTFTAAGVKLKPARDAIKGIANLAALSGSNAEQAASGMYQLSQAISTGTVRLIDWNSVQNAGFGGKVFQNAIKRVAREHGVAVDAMIKKNGSFRDSLQENWLSSDILTETLSQFTGDLTDAQLKSMGYSDKQVKKIQRLAKTAVDSATKVKTFTQLMGTLQEAAGSGWARTWQIILGDFGEAKTLFTNVNDVLGGFIQRSADARNKVLADWKKLGGRTLLIDSIANAFHTLMDILKPIREAFREIFPAKTGEDLYNLTVAIHNFTEGLKVSKGTQDNIKRTFAGLFAVLKIGTAIITGIVKSFFHLFDAFSGDGSGSILAVTGNFGDMLVALEKWLVEGGKIDAFFDKFKVALLFFSPLVSMAFRLAAAISALVSGGADAFFDSLTSSFQEASGIIDLVSYAFDHMGQVISYVLGQLGFDGIFDTFSAGADKAAKGVDKVNTAFVESKDVAGQVISGFSGVVDVLKAVGSFFGSIASGIHNAFGFIKDALSSLGDNPGEGLSNTLAVINTGFLTALYITIRSFVKNIGGTFAELRNTFKSATGVLNQVTSNLKSMQTEVRAKAILEIAAALALLAAALFVLSKIDTKDLAVSLAAVVTLMTALSTAIVVLEKKTDDFGGAARVAVLAGAMLLMGLAILSMTAAVAILGNMDTSTLAKGLTSVAVILGVVTAAALAMEKSGGASAMVVAAAAILILAAGLTALSGALLLYAAIDTKTMAEGGLKAAAALLAIALVMRAMPPDMLATAAALFIVANSLVILAGALKIMGGMKPSEIGKSLLVLGASMLILAVAMAAMTEGLPGAAALLVMAAAIAVLVPSLVILGNLKLETIGKALLALVGIFAAIAIGAALLVPVAPILLALAGAVALLGLGVALIGGGLLAFSIGLATLAASGAAGVAVLTAAVIAMAELFPLIMYQFGLGIQALATVIAHSGPQLVAAFSAVLGALIKAVIINTPKLAKMLTVLIDNGLKVLVHAIPAMVVAGIKIIGGILKGIRDNMPHMAKVGGEVIIAWLAGIGKQVKKIADAAFKLIIDFINGISDAIDKNATELADAGLHLATSIVQGIVKGLGEGIKVVVDAAKELAHKALDGAKHFLGIKSPSKEFEKLGIYVDLGFAKGIVGGLDHVQDAMNKMKDMIKASIDANKSQVDDLKGQLKDLMEHPAKNAKEIEKVNAALATATEKLKESKAARDVYRKDLADEEAHLRSLGRQYDDYTTQIDDAKKALEDAKKARDDFEASTASKFSALPDITENTTVEEYAAAIAKQDADVETFRKSLETLRNMGLSDAQYQQFLDEGVGIQPFLDELIAQGPNAVSYVGRLTSDLGTAAQNLGHMAAIDMKQAGVDAAQGLLDGLISKRADIAAEMTNIARIMVRAIKKELKSHSPSKVMEEIGGDTNEGLANGLDKTARIVEQSATNVANSAIDALKTTLSGVSDAVNMKVNTEPVIKPVLDLTQLNKDAAKMGSTLDKKMVAEASFGRAMSISSDQAAKMAEKIAAMQDAQGPDVLVQLTQNNHSPKALSEVEIYRDTKNLFSLAKEALKKPS